MVDGDEHLVVVHRRQSSGYRGGRPLLDSGQRFLNAALPGRPLPAAALETVGGPHGSRTDRQRAQCDVTITLHDRGEDSGLLARPEVNGRCGRSCSGCACCGWLHECTSHRILFRFQCHTHAHPYNQRRRHTDTDPAHVQRISDPQAPHHRQDGGRLGHYRAERADHRRRTFPGWRPRGNRPRRRYWPAYLLVPDRWRRTAIPGQGGCPRVCARSEAIHPGLVYTAPEASSSSSSSSSSVASFTRSGSFIFSRGAIWLLSQDKQRPLLRAGRILSACGRRHERRGRGRRGHHLREQQRPALGADLTQLLRQTSRQACYGQLAAKSQRKRWRS